MRMTKTKGAKIMDLSTTENETNVAVSGASSNSQDKSDTMDATTKIQLKPQMDTIFAEVEKSLPSIDFDLSDVSSDTDEPIIFHRSLKTTDYLYDDDKDLDTSLSGESLSEMVHSMAQPELSAPYDNDLALLKPILSDEFPTDTGQSWGDLKADFEKDKECSQFPKLQRQNWMPDDESNTLRDFEMPPTVTSSGTSMDDAVLDNKLLDMNDEESEDNFVGVTEFSFERQTVSYSEVTEKEKKQTKNDERGRRRELDHDIASMFVSPRAPVLSLQAFENIDLDYVLESLNEDNQYGPRTGSHYNRGAGDMTENKGSSSDDLTLIQKLAQLSVSQGAGKLGDIDPCTGAVKKDVQVDNRLVDDTLQEKTQQELKKTMTSCMGTNTNDLPGLSPPTLMTGGSQQKPEPDTVFIDLRDFEKHRQEEQQSIERVQKILGIQQESSDSSDSEDDMEQWQQQRRQIKASLTSRGVSTEPLPSKPTPFEKKAIKRPARVINLSEQNKNNKKTLDEEADKDSEQKKVQVAAQREKERQMDVARKLREQREKERESRIRMGRRIEAVRPTASVSGRHCCAENTSVIFDIEASYEPPPNTLPGVISPDQECLLLTVSLSSNSEIVLHRNKANKSVDTGSGLSASYTTLLTWLLSLVPDDFTYLKGSVKSANNDAMFIAPFHVIGLQQMWIDEQLCLAVAITPVKEFDAKYVPVKSKKSKVRDEVKDSSPFMQHVNKFLSTNTLHTVCPWLQAFVSMDVTCANRDNPELCAAYTYQPPLPNVTTKPLSTFLHINPDQKAAGKVFNTPVGFFWQTVDSDDGFYDISVNDSDVCYETQNTMSLIYKKIFHEPGALMGILNRVLQEGLDLSGVRLLYPTAELLNIKECDNNEKQSDLDLLNNIGPVLAIALRGTFARSIWLDAVGPSDPALARRTDPMSLCAQFGGASRDECLLFCPRNPARVHSELTRWFGGRVPPGGVVDVGTPYTRKDHLQSGSPKGRKGKRGSAESKEVKEARDDLLAHRPPATLTATHKSDIFLVLSPLVPPRSVGLIMSTCQRRGYQIHGVRRLKLTTKRASALGISSSEIGSFCPGTLPAGEVTDVSHAKHEATAPCIVLVLQKENSSHNAASLIEAFMIQMTLQGVLGHMQKEIDVKLTSRHLFHAATYTDGLLNLLGGDFSKCPDYELQANPSYLQPHVYTNPELEQIAVLILFGHEILKSCGLLIGKILNLVPHSKTPVVSPLSDGFELLGLKWLPALSMSQAREVTPFEVGERQWRESIHTLTSEPVMILAVRGVNAFKRLASLFPNRNSSPSHSPRGQRTSLDKMMSQTSDEAYTYIRLFFSRCELVSDPTCRPLLPYLPESKYFSSSMSAASDTKKPKLTGNLKENIFEMMLAGPQLFTTFMLIKPSAVIKHLSKIFKKMAQECFQIVGFRMVKLGEDLAKHVMPADVQQDSEEYQHHIDHLTSSPSICLCLMRENAVKRLVDVIGPEDPQSARRQSQFLWRGTFGSDKIANGLYCSSDYNQAIKDQMLFFPDGLCCEESQDFLSEEMACPPADSYIDVHHLDSRHINVIHHSHALDSYSTELAEVHEMLLQTSCLVLTAPLLQGSGRDRRSFGYVDVIEALLSHGFDLCGARMVWFTQPQAEHFLHLVDAGSFKQVPLLTSGPSLVLAMQRDNAVLAFESALGGSLSSESILRKFGHHVYRPSNIKQSHHLLTFFFDQLMPGSQIEIVKNNAEKTT